ncbi:MAG: hypothetical protein H6739_21355 [Alphaproteobacteria bacterium]|nr:hypothetical protein [Alphaproteobacteria bacterium]
MSVNVTLNNTYHYGLTIEPGDSNTGWVSQGAIGYEPGDFVGLVASSDTSGAAFEVTDLWISKEDGQYWIYCTLKNRGSAGANPLLTYQVTKQASGGPAGFVAMPRQAIQKA